jgi:hypothetical protein
MDTDIKFKADDRSPSAQQNVYAMRGFGVILKFMFQNVFRARGTVRSRSGLTFRCASFLALLIPALHKHKRYRQRLIQKKFTHPHFVAYICKRPKEDVRLQHVLVIKTLW